MTTERPLIGWKAIAEHLGVSDECARRWFVEMFGGDGVPRTPTGKPMVYPHEIKEKRFLSRGGAKYPPNIH